MHAKRPNLPAGPFFRSYEHWPLGFQVRVPCAAQGTLHETLPFASLSRANIHTGQAHVCQQATHTTHHAALFCF